MQCAIQSRSHDTKQNKTKQDERNSNERRQQMNKKNQNRVKKPTIDDIGREESEEEGTTVHRCPLRRPSIGGRTGTNKHSNEETQLSVVPPCRRELVQRRSHTTRVEVEVEKSNKRERETDDNRERAIQVWWAGGGAIDNKGREREVGTDCLPTWPTSNEQPNRPTGCSFVRECCCCFMLSSLRNGEWGRGGRGGGSFADVTRGAEG